MNFTMRTNRILFYDYARFFAIFGVIAVHSVTLINYSSIIISDEIYAFGRFGVLLFFLISGSTIWITFNSIKKKSDKPNTAFYLRRFFRIVPLFMLMGIYYSLKDGSTLINIFNPLSGLHAANLNLIDGAWSIWNEMYFYLIFPIYFYIRKSNITLVLFLLFFCLISFLINLRLLGWDAPDHYLNDFDYFNFFTQFVCFVVGVEYAAKNFKKIILSVCVYLITGLIFKYHYFSSYIFVADKGAVHWTALISIACLVFLLIVKFITENKRFNHNNFLPRLLVRLGRVTYTSYMIHFVLIDILKNHLSNNIAEINIIIIAFLTFSISVVVQKYTEEIWQNIGRNLSLRYINNVKSNAPNKSTQ